MGWREGLGCCPRAAITLGLGTPGGCAPLSIHLEPSCPQLRGICWCFILGPGAWCPGAFPSQDEPSAAPAHQGRGSSPGSPPRGITSC